MYKERPHVCYTLHVTGYTYIWISIECVMYVFVWAVFEQGAPFVFAHDEVGVALFVYDLFIWLRDVCDQLGTYCSRDQTLH